MNTAPDADGQASRSRLLVRTLLIATGIFLLLECWRPKFFLTDDNLTGGLPVMTEVGHRLLAGQPPFVSEHLFGGHYQLLQDPAFICWHPFLLLASLLAGTPAHFWILDVVAFGFFMVAAAGFVNLACFLREELSLQVTDGWLMFYALSYTYTFMALTTGSSWLTFLGNHSALPWLALGILQPTWWRGLALVALFSVHHLMGGHPAPFVTVSLAMSLFATGVAWWRRSPVPIVTWTAGNAVAIVIVLPFLWPALHGFHGSDRGDGVDFAEIEHSNVPLFVAPFSYLVGTSFWLVRHAPDHHIYRASLAACAAAWCLVPAVAGQSKWHKLELVCAGLLILLAVLIVRPDFVTRAMMHLPLLKSLRWPFRELLIFHFFLHLLLVLRPPAWRLGLRQGWATWSAAVFVLPMLLYAPPSLNPLPQERQLLFSGELDTYWAQVRTHLRPDDKIAVIIPSDIYEAAFERVCYGLLGSHNFCCLIGAVNASGYSPTAPRAALYLRTPPAYYFGAFTPDQIDSLWAERPDLKLMVLQSLHPIRIVLRSRAGPDIDLTPYVPNDVTYL